MKQFSLSQMKRVLNLSLPMAGSRFLQMFSGFISTMMVAHLGREVLASCALINATISFTMLIFISIVFSLSFIVGQSFGAKKYDEIGALVQQSMLLSFFLGLLMMVCFWYANDFLTLFHESPTMLVYVRQYFHALTWGVIPIMFQSCLEQFCYGILKQRLVIIINAISLVMAVPIAYVLIFGKLGIPPLGVEGLGLSFAIQAWIDCLILMTCCYVINDFKKFELLKSRSHQGLIYLRKVFRVGWPMSVQFGGELGAFFVVTMMIGWLGTNALAAAQVTQQWMFLLIVPIFAMSEAAGILVGQSVGAGDYHQLRAIGNSSVMLALSLVLLFSTGFIFLPNFFASFYINIHLAKNVAILHLIHILFIIMAITLVLSSMRDVLSGALRGLLDTQFPMQIGLIVMWCLVLPIGYWFAFPLHTGVIGFKMGGNIGMLIGAGIIYWRWYSKVRAY